MADFRPAQIGYAHLRAPAGHHRLRLLAPGRIVGLDVGDRAEPDARDAAQLGRVRELARERRDADAAGDEQQGLRGILGQGEVAADAGSADLGSGLELEQGPLLGTRADLLSRLGRVTRLAGSIEETGARALLLSPDPGGEVLPPAPLTPLRCLVVNRSAR